MTIKPGLFIHITGPDVQIRAGDLFFMWGAGDLEPDDLNSDDSGVHENSRKPD